MANARESGVLRRERELLDVIECSGICGRCMEASKKGIRVKEDFVTTSL